MRQWMWDEGDASPAALAAYTAHEVRNPLAALRAMAQLTLLSSDPRLHERMIRQILDGIDQLDQFLRQVVCLLRPETVAMQRVDIATVLDEVVKLFGVQAQQTGIHIGVRLTSPPPIAWGNPDLLRHVFINLLKNALEAMPQGGPILLSARVCRRRGMVRVAVRDRGSGIPEGLRERVLTDTTMTSRSSGGGIGLPFVRQVVQDIHQGNVWFRTKTDAGTLFVVEVPSICATTVWERNLGPFPGDEATSHPPPGTVDRAV